MEDGEWGGELDKVDTDSVTRFEFFEVFFVSAPFSWGTQINEGSPACRSIFFFDFNASKKYFC